MPDPYSHDDLKAKLAEPGWRHINASGESQTGTLQELAVKAHADRAEHPGTIKEIETAIELELVHLQQLWHYLGLPD